MATPLQPGDRFAGHEILRPISITDNAAVYAARAPGGEPRALKILTANVAVTSEVRARFLQQGEAIAAVVHPNVVRLYDAGEWAGQVWLSFELVEAETLGHKIRSGVPLPLDDVLCWIQQVCDGLAEAHRAGVIHRNLTPDNILITPSGSVKIIDFAMAKLEKFGIVSAGDTMLGSMMYMSPEQARYAPASPSMDVYGLGHVLYEAVARVHAIGSEPRSLPAIVSWQLSVRPPPLRTFAPEIPGDLEALVHKMLEKDPAERPASMGAVNTWVRKVRSRLWAPQRRAARNVPRLERTPDLSPTIPMPAVEPSQPSTARITPPLAVVPSLPEARSTDAPVETSRPPAAAPPRNAIMAACVAGVVMLGALGASGWMIVGRVLGATVEAPSEPRPAASAPTQVAPVAPTQVASVAPTQVAVPAVTAQVSARPARRPAGPTPRVQPRPPQAKNRLFGTDP